MVSVPAGDSYTIENNMIALEILKIIVAFEKTTLDQEKAMELIANSRQPCRLERVKDREETIILDVCHNIDGFKAVINEIKSTYPAVENIKIVIGLSKGKKLDNLVEFLDSNDMISEVNLVSRPHMRLFKIDEIHRAVQMMGCKKLVDPFGVGAEA